MPIPLFKFKFAALSFSEFPLKEKHQLKNLTDLNESGYHTPVFLGWNRDGLGCQFHFSKQEFYCIPTHFKEGDAIELFVDTRDNKQSNFPTKFCHHFLFFPEQVEGIYGKEITRFRGEETHDLAHPKNFTVAKRGARRGAVVEIFIPKEALYGYDPEQFNRFGFTYRLHVRDREPQLFSTSPQFSIEQNPSYFASFEMR